MRVAVIGLGAMGLPMARRILAAGHDVTAWDLSVARRNEALGITLVERGSRGAEVIVLSLPHDDAVRGAAETILTSGPAPGCVVLDCSTVAPETPRALAPRFAEAGLAWVDAPVSGGPAGAAAGTLTVMAGAEPGVLDRARPVLDAIAGKVVHVGGPGAGAVAKLVNNLLVAAHLLTAAEALRMGVRAGVDLEALLAVVNGASGRSAATEVNFPRWIASGAFDSGFTAGLMRKDLRLAAALAEAQGGAGPVSQSVLAAWAESAVTNGADFNRVAEAVFRDE
ncbi:NAD(P)-dependent oxidoreductase [Elioraea rosea]|uniref:NAD(P)-dependent oxidoreductase n=1 Tax=Elioraea rosea TaxID=2492390 RepID=UPI0011845F47|nr:NAD(P)-dependent oxidoreductase [Elioraea rosea]